VFPQAVKDKFVQLRVSEWDEDQPMPANLVGKVILFWGTLQVQPAQHPQ